MNYSILFEDPGLSLIERLLKVRSVEDDVEEFLNPTMKKYRISPFKLADMNKAIDRIKQALTKQEKIMIFGDYDVDGITSSFMLYTFFRKFLKYENISIMFPNRLEDGYWLKSFHLDEMKEKSVDLVITVDNGITSINEALHAKEIWIDLVITDHHKNLETIPEACAVVNPQVSPDYNFKWICGAGVAFKLLNGYLEAENHDIEQRKKIFNYFLPVVAIATVADCVPLVDENRVMVKQGLKLLNQKSDIPESLISFIDYLGIKDDINSFHIGYIIGPRINAGGRIVSPYKSLYTLLHTWEKQREHLDMIESINTERKKLQDQASKLAEKMLCHDDFLLTAHSEEFHEGIIGIVSGRITEKNNKPSIVLSLCPEKGVAVASLRGPEYFSVIDMLIAHGDLLERYWGHKQAGWLTVKLENVDTLLNSMRTYCKNLLQELNLEKIMKIDTKLYPQEISSLTLDNLMKLEPFGQGNEEPLFFIENATILTVNKVGSRGNGHLKFQFFYDGTEFQAMHRSKGGLLENFQIWQKISLAGKLKKDTFNGWVFIDIQGIF